MTTMMTTTSSISWATKRRLGTEEVDERVGNRNWMGERPEVARAGDFDVARAGDVRGRLAGARWWRIDVVFERDDQAGNANRRPGLRTRTVQRPCETRLVLSEPAGIRPRGHVADKRDPTVDDRVLLQVGVR